MTTTATPLLEGECCNPCNSCGDCKEKCVPNIQSSNPDCLRVDTSECGVITLEPVCPPVVVAGKDITVTVEDCDEGEDCSKKYTVSSNAPDEKVKACSGDSTPGTLDEKLVAGEGIIITPHGCNGVNSHLEISLDEDAIKPTDEKVAAVEGCEGGYLSDVLVSKSKSVRLRPDTTNCTLILEDKADDTYNNICCVGLYYSQNVTGKFYGSDQPSRTGTTQAYFIDKRDFYTGNGELCSSDGITIKKEGHYRVFAMLTIRNNYHDDGGNSTKHINLGRGLVQCTGDRVLLNDLLLNTAKHGEYARTNDPATTGPWATFNMECYVDLHEGDKLTLGYRPQSNDTDRYNDNADFMFIGTDDASTSYNAFFGGTCLGVQFLSPTLFQDDTSNKVYSFFRNDPFDN